MNLAGWASSLRVRLLLATIAALAVALVLAGVGLQGLFRDHVMRQFEAGLLVQLDQLAARFDVDDAGRPRVDAAGLSDPRWDRPLSGLYWQVDALTDEGSRIGVLRSRSLWDQELRVDRASIPAGELDVRELTGPDREPLLLLARSVRADPGGGAHWRLIVAADARAARDAVSRFTGVLAASLGLLGALLCAAAFAQVAVGLAPLRAMQRQLVAVREGRSARLQGRFPAEVQPLIDEFNRVIDRNAEVVERARTHAGNLAHAIKTPLSVMAQAAEATARREDAGPAAADLARVVTEQIAASRRHVDRHLARARAAAASRLPGTRTPVAPVLAALARVMARVHAERDIRFELRPGAEALAFAGDEQDLHEMLGNVLDNAFKWARTAVTVRIEQAPLRDGSRLRVIIDDDGPGLAPQAREAVRARGMRADEAVPGSGLGLAIVDDLVALYDGELALGTADSGGLRVTLTLPAVAPG